MHVVSRDNTLVNNQQFSERNNHVKVELIDGLVVSIGILVLISAITVASYFCRRKGEGSTSRSEGQQEQNQDCVIHVVGSDEATLKTHPKCSYSELEKKKQESTEKRRSMGSCCSICLAEYKAGDVLRELPDCEHAFHLKCVDTWLRLNPTCPVCRTSPLPTPLSTPLAEAVPLANAGNSTS